MAIPFLIANIGALLELKRTCPVCRKNQLIPIELKHRVVKGKFCGANISARLE